MIKNIFPFVLIFLFFCLLTTMGYIAFFLKPKTRLERFVDKFSVIAAVFVPIGIFTTFLVFQIQSEKLKRESTYTIIDRSWLDINQKLKDNFEQAPHFVNSLYFSWQKKGQHICIQETKKCDEWYVVNYLCISIFQAWEDFLTSSKVDQVVNQIWIHNFLQWANSTILKEKWQVLKGNLAPTTQFFGDYLFEMVEQNKPKNQEELQNLSQSMYQSRRYKRIIQKRHEEKFFRL